MFEYAIRCNTCNQLRDSVTSDITKPGAVYKMKVFIVCALTIGTVLSAPAETGLQKVEGRNEVIQKRQGFRDSYLEALEYSHNSAAIQGTDEDSLGTRIANFFRNGNVRLSRGAVAAAVGIPVATLAAAAMIFPFAAGKRKRRSVEGEEPIDAAVSPMGLLAERAQQIYSAVRESDDCWERLACEIGGFSKGYRLTNPLLRVASVFAGDSYRKYLARVTAATEHDDEVDMCRKRLKCKPIGL